MIEDTITYNNYVDDSPDNNIWKPIALEERSFYLGLINNVRHSFKSGTKKQKGDSLEELMSFIYNRFKAIRVYHNEHRGDNQIDHVIEFIDGMAPTFIHRKIGLKIIGESKNHNKSISVREVADLDELLRSKEAELGIFSSYKSFSKGKTLWVYGEGKRRKLSLSNKRKIIGYNIDELESLIQNNFYTMLKQKYENLVNEIEDDYTDEDGKLSYQDKLYCSLKQLNKLGIIDGETFKVSIGKLEEKFGSIDLEL
ncbi:hypothetical protein CCZ20_28115 [Priestia aryabhattai]|uniref:restriction endonuclease n=1 Tax=Priestia aryabhattai TaxID=412384 RepID=UPI000B513B13|nr:restriction endonuclease [Priestia aryabhattai]OVE34134.1 hypothetical protein CCZ20_28115 [Priestia aryabhattai]